MKEKASGWPKDEAELGLKAVSLLRAEGWTVYQEVSRGFGDIRADIVATQGKWLIVIETKKSMSLALVSQGMAWRPYAHRVFLVVPDFSPWTYIRTGHDVANALGLDVVKLRETQDQSYDWRLRDVEWERHNIQPDPAAMERLRKRLTEEHKTFAPAGNADGKFYSTFQATCAELRKYVAAHPGTSMKEAVSSIEHHYASEASARNALGKWITAGKVEGIEWMEVKGKQRWGLRACAAVAEGGVKHGNK